MILTAGAGVGHGQVTNWVATFNSSADSALWSHQSGDSATDYISFLPGDAPPGQTNSGGCMVLQCAFSPSLTWTVIGKNVHGINVSNCTALELDVKVDPAQTVYDSYANACNSFQITLGCGSSDTWFGTDTGPIAPIAGYNGWQHVVVPASAFAGYTQGINTNWSNVQWVLIEPVDGYFPGTTTNNMVLRIANVKFTAPGSAPAAPTITIDASNAVRTADSRWFGINTGNYDYDFNLQHTVPEYIQAGWGALRYPGGSGSDSYHWNAEIQNNNRFTNFARVATNLATAVIITANYGTGTPAEAAGWVAFSNVTNHFGFKYWEIGNEVYAPYTEVDNNVPSHDPYTYASRAATYIQQMKAQDPTIKVGVVVVKGEELDPGTNAIHAATNLVTGQIFYGWTPVVMSTLRQLGVMPDFAIYHYYPEPFYSGALTPDDDTRLLAMANWAGDAAEIRGDINDFFGPAGTNIEILITENNNDEGTPGKQSVSLVNALYYADSLGQIMQTEINARVWWQLHDGGAPYSNGDLSTNLYGWRNYGAFGIMDWEQGLQLTNRYPPYFAAELISHFIRGGDTVVNASCNNPLVSAYAALRTNGSLTLMAINKSSNTTYTANIVLTNYMPTGTATVYSYGMPQDSAAQAGNNSTCDITTNSYGVSKNFSYALAPYSITVMAFAAAPAATQIGGISVSGDQLLFSYPTASGQTYQLQYTTDLNSGSWLPTGSAVPGTGAPVFVTNSISSSVQMFFRLSITTP